MTNDEFANARSRMEKAEKLANKMKSMDGLVELVTKDNCAVLLSFVRQLHGEYRNLDAWYSFDDLALAKILGEALQKGLHATRTDYETQFKAL